LKRRDQILEVSGQSFDHVTHPKALEVLRGTTELCITVKSKLLGT
jgi:Rap guanine nucleotide exchange factor 2